MRKIIDIHMHIGDIFHENKNITFKTGIKKGGFDDPFIACEASGYTEELIAPEQEDQNKVIDAGQYRVWQATLENTLADMEEAGVVKACALPCFPNTTFEEYLAASKMDDRIIPFAGVDLALSIPDLKAKLKKDIERGAKGLKIHPILQKTPLDDERFTEAAKVFGEAGLPINVHVGMGTYYRPDSPWAEYNVPELGHPKYIYAFARKFPEYTIISAHSCWICEDVYENTKGLNNIYVDTSFCPAVLVKRGVELLGPDKVMFGTDYPFGSFEFNARIVEAAFPDDPEMREKVFYGNAAKILNL